MRPLKFRARFRKVSTGETIWQFASLHRRGIVSPYADMQPGYMQASGWEQYTGIMDKHGDDIYEGDIVSFPSDINDFYSIICQDLKIKEKKVILSKVFFENGCFAFNFQYGYEGMEVSWDDVEVIGNIHEHPDLLTKEKTSGK